MVWTRNAQLLRSLAAQGQRLSVSCGQRQAENGEAGKQIGLLVPPWGKTLEMETSPLSHLQQDSKYTCSQMLSTKILNLTPRITSIRSVLMVRRDSRQLPLPCLFLHMWTKARTASLEKGGYQYMTMWASWSWTTILQNYEKKSFCGLSHSVYDILFWEPIVV